MTAALKSVLLPLPAAILALGIGAALAIVGVALRPQDWAAGVLLAFTLAWASAVDVRRLLLPNVLTIGLIVAGLAVSAAVDWPDFASHAVGAIAGYLLVAAVAWCFQKLRGQQGIGMGDAKLLAAAGAWLGVSDLPFVVLAASILGIAFMLGLAVARRRMERNLAIPFGPFIALAFWTIWLFQPVWRDIPA